MIKNLKPNAFKVITTIVLLLIMPVFPIKYGMHAHIGSIIQIDFFSLLSLIMVLIKKTYRGLYLEEYILINLLMSILSIVVVYIVVALIISPFYKAIRERKILSK